MNDGPTAEKLVKKWLDKRNICQKENLNCYAKRRLKVGKYSSRSGIPAMEVAWSLYRDEAKKTTMRKQVFRDFEKIYKLMPKACSRKTMEIFRPRGNMRFLPTYARAKIILLLATLKNFNIIKDDLVSVSLSTSFEWNKHQPVAAIILDHSKFF